MTVRRAFDASCSNIFSGNLYDPIEIQSWILEELESQAIRNVDEDTLEMLIDKSDDIVIIFFDGNKKKQKKFVAALDTVDDEAEKLEIFMVKNGNPETARWGLTFKANYCANNQTAFSKFLFNIFS